MTENLVIKKSLFLILVVINILIIVGVGLLAGLVGRPETSSNDDGLNPSKTTTTAPTTTPITEKPLGPWNNIRLPLNLVPYHYDVELKPDLQPDSEGEYWFTGTSSVDFTVATETNFIYIHCNKLDITSISLISYKGSEVEIKSWEIFQPFEYLVVELQLSIKTNENYTLFTSFKGELANDLRGLYRSTYTNVDGNDVVIAVSQMQPTDARKSFPCFDEPAFKARFDIKLTFRDGFYGISNMPEKITEDVGNGWKRTTFEETYPMSTYLLAFVVCDFDYVESFTSRNVQTRIYSTDVAVKFNTTFYAKTITPIILDYYEEYFDVDYPLPKSDQISIPDFALGGMENWGLVMYRETALLYDPTVNSESNKASVARIIAHELSHQWFGDLITPVWWDELWLNEGFATFVEYIGTSRMEPEWNYLDTFVISDLRDAMSVDALTSSRPIVAENIETPAQINGLFDDISYSKGGCIIRMIEHFTGENAFKTGLKNYFNKFAYGSVDHTNLFNYWEEALQQESSLISPPGGFNEAMNTWVIQMGFPVVTFSRKSGSDDVVVTQQRFLLDQTADPLKPQSPYNYKWSIPLWYQVQDELEENFLWFDKETDEVTLNIAEDKYFIGNNEVYGYYRVNYDVENWNKIIDALMSNYEAISLKNRANLIDDAFSLANAGLLDLTIALDTTRYLVLDNEYLPWESALDALAYFELVLGRSKVFGLYKSYLNYLVEPLYNQTAWKDLTDHNQIYQQINAIGVACNYGKSECVDKALEEFNNWKDSSSQDNNISPNLRSQVYCTAVSYGNEVQWDFLWSKYQTETNSQERSKLQYGLTCPQEAWIITRFLDYTLDTNYVRKQDADRIYENLCYNEYARDLTWDFIRTNFDYIYEVYGTSFFSFSGIISSCTSHFSTQFELDELNKFSVDFANKLGSGQQAVDQAIEKTTNNVKWRSKNEEVVYNWLQQTLNEIDDS